MELTDRLQGGANILAAAAKLKPLSRTQRHLLQLKEASAVASQVAAATAQSPAIGFGRAAGTGGGWCKVDSTDTTEGAERGHSSGTGGITQGGSRGGQQGWGWQPSRGWGTGWSSYNTQATGGTWPVPCDT
jgi:hypothetical protein